MAPNLSPISSDSWLRPDTEAPEWLSEKRELMVRCRGDVYAAIRGSERARTEASRLVFEHLNQKNHFYLRSELEDAASQVSDDLCIMEQNESGEWCLTAASLCSPTYWSLRENLGKSLGGLHKPVPGGDPELAARVARVFSAMRTDQIFERYNWTIQAGNERYLPTSEGQPFATDAISPNAALEELRFRVERQTIRKLPKTGAVLFTIRICLDPLASVFAVPDAKDAFAHAWTEAHPDVARYKGWATYEHLIDHVLG